LRRRRVQLPRRLLMLQRNHKQVPASEVEGEEEHQQQSQHRLAPPAHTKTAPQRSGERASGTTLTELAMCTQRVSGMRKCLKRPTELGLLLKRPTELASCTHRVSDTSIT